MKFSKLDNVILKSKFFDFGDYMIPVCRNEISTRPAGAYFTLRLHVEIKFQHGKAGQFSTCYLFRFPGTFFEFFCKHVSLQIENP